ncbi:MAG: 50S ribosomal protein L11 methyltransferase [Pseudomonadota bacterium]
MTKRLTWRGERAILEEAERALTELMEPPVEATSLIRDDDASGPPNKASWILHAYTDHEISEVMLSLLPENLSPPHEEELEDRDWVAHSLEGLGVIRAGPFVLFGSHDAERASDEPGIKLQVEANQAFGTGHHPTTAGCLEALGQLRANTPSKILDIGCGSGVLAMAARKLWQTSTIVATDIDPQSVKISQDNAHINGTGDIIFETASGTDAPATEREAPFDLVLANILAGPLRELAPDIAAVSTPGATLVMAGLLDEQQASVEAAYKTQGFAVIDQFGTPRWPVLVLTRRTSEATL